MLLSLISILIGIISSWFNDLLIGLVTRLLTLLTSEIQNNYSLKSEGISNIKDYLQKTFDASTSCLKVIKEERLGDGNTTIILSSRYECYSVTIHKRKVICAQRNNLTQSLI